MSDAIHFLGKLRIQEQPDLSRGNIRLHLDSSVRNLSNKGESCSHPNAFSESRADRLSVDNSASVLTNIGFALDVASTKGLGTKTRHTNGMLLESSVAVTRLLHKGSQGYIRHGGAWGWWYKLSETHPQSEPDIWL